jgi:hypothetical protein
MAREKQDKFTGALLKPINPTAIILLGIYTVVWGFWLANPWWDAFSRAALYSVLARSPIAEWGWGCIAIFCGSITCWGAYRRSYHPLLIGSAVAGWHWLMISIFYIKGDWQNTGGITALTFAIYAAFIYLNIKVNHNNGGQEMDEILQ